MAIRTAGIIIVGREILSGDVQDENVQFLCRRFQELGVKVEKAAIVDDNVDDIADEVGRYSKTYDLVITSGGVGPTPDDVTYQGVAKAFHLQLEVDKDLLLYWGSNPQENQDSACKMSTVPKSSRVIYGEDKKYPVVVVDNVYIFPGTPENLQRRFCALEAEHFSGFGTKFYQREIYLSVDETVVISALNETVRCFADVGIGSYPVIDNADYWTRLTIHSHQEHRVAQAHGLLLSLIRSSWILDPQTFSSKI